MNAVLLLPIVFPILAGALLFLLKISSYAKIYTDLFLLNKTNLWIELQKTQINTYT